MTALGCTDIESLQSQLSGHDAGPDDEQEQPSGGTGGAGAQGGSGGAPSGGLGGMTAGVGGAAASSGAAGTANVGCEPGWEGCACDAGACEEGLTCADGTCRSPQCGNGTIDVGEECDDGNDVDTDACTSACADARCGDGIVRSDTESCDDGNEVEFDTCSNACVTPYNVAFVTSTTYQVLTLGGTEGGDAACAERAAAAGLPGTFVAWLTSPTQTIAERLAGARGWVRTDGKPFLDEVTDRATFYPPRLDEHGKSVSSDGPRAFGNDANGPLNNTCDDWTNEGTRFSSGDPTGGSGAWNGTWATSVCSAPFRLYCFQRDAANPLKVEPVEGRRAFLSSQEWVPSGGLANADALCNQSAIDAGLSGTFKALLGTSTASAASRFSTDGPTWVRIDGIPIVEEAADLFKPYASLTAPLQLTAAGLYFGNFGAWSGGIDPNVPGTATCSDWTSSAASATGAGGRVFFTPVAKMLGYDLEKPCSEGAYLYCLEE